MYEAETILKLTPEQLEIVRRANLTKTLNNAQALIQEIRPNGYDKEDEIRVVLTVLKVITPTLQELIDQVVKSFDKHKKEIEEL